MLNLTYKLQRLAPLFLLLMWQQVQAQTPSSRHHLGVGINYGGAQIDWNSSLKWTWELRVQQGTDKSEDTKTKSMIMGARAYRHFRPHASLSPYGGLQISYVDTNQTNSDYNASGESVGLFVGLRKRLPAHFSLLFDMGPYFISLREKVTRVDQTEINFIGDVALVYTF